MYNGEKQDRASGTAGRSETGLCRSHSLKRYWSPRDDGYAALDGDLLGAELIAHLGQHIGGRAHEQDAVFLARPGKIGVLGQKAVAGMDGGDAPYELVHSEAEKSFGCGDIFMEKYLVEPKHIEVQILADQYGNVYHLGERDCSLQRRYQKVVEFAPAWSVPEETVEALRRDAVKIAKSVRYVSAGTVEFLVDKSGNYYFIEMNPRIQVEHTVTEMVTGVGPGSAPQCAWAAPGTSQ